MIYRSIIDGQSGAPFIEDALEQSGPLLNAAPVVPEVLAEYDGKVPDLMLDFWEAHGVGDLHGGRMRLCVPRSLQGPVDALFLGDPDLGGDIWPLAYGAFGDILAWSGRHQLVHVNMQLSSVDAPVLIDPTRRVPDDKALLAGLLLLHPGTFDAYDESGQEMFDRAVEILGPLPPLSIYGMFPVVPRDEPFEVSRHRIVEADEWLDRKIADSIFTLDDPIAGRFGLRPIGGPTDMGDVQ